MNHRSHGLLEPCSLRGFIHTPSSSISQNSSNLKLSFSHMKSTSEFAALFANHQPRSDHPKSQKSGFRINHTPCKQTRAVRDLYNLLNPRNPRRDGPLTSTHTLQRSSKRRLRNSQTFHFTRLPGRLGSGISYPIRYCAATSRKHESLDR
jgi:hypothetical protein